MKMLSVWAIGTFLAACIFISGMGFRFLLDKHACSLNQLEVPPNRSGSGFLGDPRDAGNYIKTYAGSGKSAGGARGAECSMDGVNWFPARESDSVIYRFTCYAENVARTPVVAVLSRTVSVCDDSLWAHVYNRERLVEQEPCVTVTGVKRDATKGKEKDGCRREADGDLHCWLRLDPLQNSRQPLIGRKNIEDQEGNLVFEPMCQHKVTQADTIKSQVCKNWNQDNLFDAPVGEHLRITGAFVLDKQHGWYEIHPVTSIDPIPGPMRPTSSIPSTNR